MIKLSVIIPYYNAENYLSRCVDSILGQPFDSIQIILVDDGSFDNSPAIADAYIESNKIVSLHIPHSGVSAARNAGIEVADGEYITFVDADDWLDANCLIERWFDGDYDIIRIPCNLSSSMIHYNQDVMCHNQEEVFTFLKKNYCSACWARFYKKSVVAETRFNVELRMGEDILFFVELFPRINCFHVVSGISGYHYNMGNENSATQKLGYSADLRELVMKLHIHASHRNQLAWLFLFSPCFNHCQTYGLLSYFYHSFGWLELLIAPISIRKRCHLLKKKLLY